VDAVPAGRGSTNWKEKSVADQSSESSNSDFARRAEEASPGIVREFLQFVVETRKWWLIPILIAGVFIAAVVALSSSAVAPLIYPLF